MKTSATVEALEWGRYSPAHQNLRRRERTGCRALLAGTI